ncbi:MAG: EI24 domain-containing protein [Desulfomonile tiedjei]|nr:EI24 domain-containing protein [Desulfomonile tiedjei]
MELQHRTVVPAISLLSSLLYVVRGARFLWTHRSLWKYAAAPTAISTVLVGGTYVLLYKLSGNISRFVDTSAWYGQVVYYAVVVLVAVVVTLVVVFLFTRIASALAAPFNDLISQRTEQLATGIGDEEPFSVILLLKDSLRSLHHSLKILGIYLALMVGGLPLLLIPGLGHLIYTVGGALLSAYMFSYEYLGYPMDRRRFSWEEKKGFLRSRLRAVFGFGLGSVVMASIPVVNLLFIPVAVVGATLLFLDLCPRDRS